MDATFGTNKWKFALTTFMVVDEHKHGIPVCWMIHSSAKTETLLTCLDKIADHMGADFCPSVVIVDDCTAEINALRACKWCKEQPSGGATAGVAACAATGAGAATTISGSAAAARDRGGVPISTSAERGAGGTGASGDAGAAGSSGAAGGADAAGDAGAAAGAGAACGSGAAGSSGKSAHASPRPPAQIFLCVWHVKRAWLKNAIKKVRDWVPRSAVLDAIYKILEMKDMAAAEKAMEVFLSKWVRHLWVHACSPTEYTCAGRQDARSPRVNDSFPAVSEGFIFWPHRTHAPRIQGSGKWGTNQKYKHWRNPLLTASISRERYAHGRAPRRRVGKALRTSALTSPNSGSRAWACG